MKLAYTTIFAILATANLFADHLISDLEGEWYSSIFPQSIRYTFYGVRPEGKARYVVRHIRPTTNGECVGSGVLNLSSGHLRSVEVCPSKDGNPANDTAFFASWHLVHEHEELHLKGGYYSEGSAAFQAENLDKEPHR